MIPSLFFDFSIAAERIAGTSSPLEKAAVAGEYFRSLSDDDLTHAARYFAGYVFPLRDQRVVSVGGATLLTAALTVTGAEENALRRSLVATGDIGDAVFEFWPQQGEPSLTLSEVAAAFDELAVTTGSKAKLALVTKLLQQAVTPIEGKYLVKLLAGDLRIGLREGAVEDALARSYGASVSAVQWANMLTGDATASDVLQRG